MSITPTLEEVRRHWGLAVDIHRREERLAAFDRMIEAIKAEAWDKSRQSLFDFNYEVARKPDTPLPKNPYREES